MCAARPQKLNVSRRRKRGVYKNYTTVEGLTVATRFRGFNVVDGVLTDFKNEAWAGEISFTKPFDESRLLMPEDGRVQPMP